MRKQFGKNMNYNIVVIISLVISAVISLLISYYGVLLLLEETSSFFKFAQLVVAVTCMTSFYSPLKYFLLKYMEVDINEGEKDDK